MGKKNKDRVAKERTPLEPVPDSVTDGDSKFARALGSGDFHTRDRGLKALAAWLQSQDTVELDSLQKLWKGILYCFWHSDKEPVQRDLALRLAGLLSQVQDEVHSLPSSMQLYQCSDDNTTPLADSYDRALKRSSDAACSRLTFDQS